MVTENREIALKINFTKKEYRHLLDLITLGEWVINAHRVGSEGRPKHYEDLIQKIYRFSKEMDCDDIIDYAKSDDHYYPNDEYMMESEMCGYMEQFEADSMWEQLVASLGERDMVKQHGARLKDMQPEERMKISWEAESVWGEEFEKHGLDRLVIGEK